MSFKILIIDSEDNIKIQYSGLLKDKTCIINVADSIDSGLEILHSCPSKTAYQLIIIDDGVIPPDYLNQEIILEQFGETLVLLLLRDSKIFPTLTWTVSSIFAFLKPFDSEVLKVKVQRIRHWATLQKQHEYNKLITNVISPMVQKNHLSLALGNHPDHILLAIDYILMFLENCGVIEEDLFRVKLGVTECLINAIAHGNLAMSSPELKGKRKNFDLWDSEMLRRSQDPEYRDKRVRLDLSYDVKEGVLVKVEDEGEGFDIAKVLAKEKNQEEMYDPFGRGLIMVQSTSDTMEFNEKGNCLTLRYFIEYKS